MTNETLKRAISWIEEYQPTLTNWTELYISLINEELKETEEAINKKDLNKILDWVWDTILVGVWFYFFANKEGKILEAITWLQQVLFSVTNIIENYIQFDWIKAQLIEDLLSVIIDSNFTKSKSLDWNWKVIKGENFKEPNIQSIIDKYKIEIKKESN